MRIGWGKKKDGETPPPPSKAGAPAPALAPTSASGIRCAAAAVKEAPKSLAQVLMQEDNVSRGQMEEALAAQKEEGGFLG
ncbi:MAG TPA: hypothetical protein QF901_13660 [Gammaproteobacteria bacterium]|jgi:hypothetical protein|nr:hypothetical protein [Candidatus Hydrogenedentota bacterium]HJP37019.1 hypothetical protein [Gammaproteobacteria bacterium]